jgi:hypothetical protein
MASLAQLSLARGLHGKKPFFLRGLLETVAAGNMDINSKPHNPSHPNSPITLKRSVDMLFDSFALDMSPG